jgi:hypothetical protein
MLLQRVGMCGSFSAPDAAIAYCLSIAGAAPKNPGLTPLTETMWNDRVNRPLEVAVVLADPMEPT